MERYGDNCTTKRSKNAQQKCQKMHNKNVKKCTISKNNDTKKF